MGDASDVIGYDWRAWELSHATLHMKQEVDRIEKMPPKHKHEHNT